MEIVIWQLCFLTWKRGGLSTTDDILQISMKCGNSLFTSFITPVRPINPTSTKVTGLSKIHKKLFQHGREVPTLSRKTVFLKALEYLQSLKKNVYLLRIIVLLIHCD